MVKDKSANQLYKEQKRTGQTTLAFLPWLEREKTKAYFNMNGDLSVPVNKPFNDSVQQVIKELHEKGGLKEEAGKEYILGIKRGLFIWTGAIVVIVTTGIIIYRTVK